MSIVKDLYYLRQMCRDVTPDDNPLDVAKELLEALTADYGSIVAVGVAANQIRHQIRMIIMADKPRLPIYLVNPTVTKVRGHQRKPETCLSLPGQEIMMARPAIVTVRAFNQYFKPVRHTFRGFQARVFCHELDHLNGKLITDTDTDTLQSKSSPLKPPT